MHKLDLDDLCGIFDMPKLARILLGANDARRETYVRILSPAAVHQLVRILSRSEQSR